MLILKIFCELYFVVVTKSLVIDRINESAKHLFENNENEQIRNMNLGISCHIYNFDKIKFYELDTRSTFIDYLAKTKSQVTDKPAMTFISIILHKIPNYRIIKTEVQKILQIITSQEDYYVHPNNEENIYQIKITKMDLDSNKKDLFNKLPNLNHQNHFSNELLKQKVFNVFLLEDISKNYTLKMVLRKEIEIFFLANSRKNNKNFMMKILIIEAIYFQKHNMFIDLNRRLNDNLQLKKSILYTCFIAFDLIEDTFSYYHTSTELRNKRNISKIPIILESCLKTHNRSSLFYYKRSIENNLDYKIKFLTKDIEFEIQKLYDSNDTYTKLLNFLGYVPLENFFSIDIIIKNDTITSISFQIKISLHKKMLKEPSYKTLGNFKYIKQIVVSKVENNNVLNLLVDYSYETGPNNLLEFPLSDNERKSIQENGCKENNEAGKLINFIDFYESFILGRHYFYFKQVYCSNLDFTKEFCFYKREIWFKYLDLDQIYKILENSFKFQNDVNLRKNTIFKSLKSIKVFEFKREYTKNMTTDFLYSNIKILKRFKSHHFNDIELRFYSNIKFLKFFKKKQKDMDINNFIKIDFGFNKNYFIFFKEVRNNETNKDILYDINNMNIEAKGLLSPIFMELYCLDDYKEAEKYSLNFIEVIFSSTKSHINDNIMIEKVLCKFYEDYLHFFLPKTHELLANYLGLVCNKQSQNEKQNFPLIKRLYNTSIHIVKSNFKNVLYEACVLRSLSNTSDKSQKLLEGLLQN